MKDWFKNLEAKGKRLVYILGIISVIGTSSLTKVFTSMGQRIKMQNTTIQVLSAQVQTFHPTIYSGEVEIFRKKFFGLWKKSLGTYIAQIRYGDYYDEKENRTVDVYWLYIRVAGNIEIYHAIPFDGTYYFYDWHMDRQWVKNLERVD